MSHLMFDIVDIIIRTYCLFSYLVWTWMRKEKVLSRAKKSRSSFFGLKTSYSVIPSLLKVYFSTWLMLDKSISFFLDG